MEETAASAAWTAADAEARVGETVRQGEGGVRVGWGGERSKRGGGEKRGGIRGVVRLCASDGVASWLARI